MLTQYGCLHKADDDWSDTFDEIVDRVLGLSDRETRGDFYWKVVVQEAVWVVHSVMEDSSIKDARDFVSLIERRRTPTHR